MCHRCDCHVSVCDREDIGRIHAQTVAGSGGDPGSTTEGPHSVSIPACIACFAHSTIGNTSDLGVNNIMGL